MEWIELALSSDRWHILVNVVKNIRILYNARNFLTNWKPVSFSTTTLLHAVTLYQQQVQTNTIQNKVISAARLEVTEGPVALY